MELGKKIKLLRKEKGITQEQLADVLSVSSQAVSKWETGVSNPDISLISDIAKLFDISADELLGINTINNVSSTDNEQDLFSKRLDRLERIIAVLSANDDNEALGIMLEQAKKQFAFDFTEIEDFEKSDWKLYCSELVEGRNKLIFKAVPIERIVGKTVDPMVVNPKLELNIDNVTNIFIRIKTVINCLGSVQDFVQNFFNIPVELGVYFVTKESPDWNENKRIKNLYATNIMSNVCLNTGSNPFWRGTLTGIRIDPMEKLAGVVEIERISLVDVNGEVVYDYDFTDAESFYSSDWYVSCAKQLESTNCLKLDVTEVDKKNIIYDPMVQNDSINVDISRAKYVHIRIKTLLENLSNRGGWTINDIYYDSFLKVYFKTENNNTYSEDKSVSAFYGSGAMTDVYVDMSKNSLWNGKLTGLRVDPVEHRGGCFEIELIEILEAPNASGVGEMLTGIQNRQFNIEDMIGNLELRLCELEERIDNIEE